MLSSSFAHAKTQRVQHINLTVGVHRDVRLPRLAGKIKAEGTFRRITKIQHNAKKNIVRFVPIKPGVGTMVIKNKTTGAILYQFNLHVSKTNLHKMVREIKFLLRDIDGIEVKILNDKIVVDGKILLPKDIARIHSVVKQYPDHAMSLVTLNPEAQVRIAQFMERAIGNPQIHVRAINNKFFITGVANSIEEKQKAKVIAEAYAPDVIVDEATADRKILSRKSEFVIDLVRVRQAKPQKPKTHIIQIIVRYVELKKNYSRGFNFNWTPSLDVSAKAGLEASSSKGVGAITSAITGVVANLMPKLNWAKQHGAARELKSSSIIIESGQSGSLDSLTDYPYTTMVPTGSGSVPQTSFKSVGLSMKLTPTLGSGSAIKLQTQLSVSALVGISSGAPIVSQQRINTIVTVANGESAAIGGLVANNKITGYNSAPPGVKNPLFSLYSSKDFQKNQSQFVVFITPVLKSFAHEGSDIIRRKFRLRN